jgi:hypothetical protein
MTAPKLASANTENSLSGSFSVGAIVIDSGNNLNPEGSDKRLGSLDSAADRQTTIVPGVLPEVTWDVGEPEGVKFYLTTDPPIDEVGGFSINLGTSYGLGQVGVIDTAVFFTPFEKAWENPYITGVDRKETDTSKYGFRIGLNRIMGTGFRAQFVYLADSVEDDTIGELFPELARDGSVYSLNLNYSHFVGEKLELRPRISIRAGDYEGEANSFVKFKFDFEARYTTGQWLFVPRIFYSHSAYIEDNPIFDKTRNSNRYGVSLMTTYMAPFDMEKWSVSCLVDLSKGDSNIDFYDTESMTAGALLSYHL